MKAEKVNSIENEPYHVGVNEDIANSLPSFNKKAILKHLSQFGCSEISFNDVMSRFKYPKEVVIDYLNDLLSQSERYLDQECSSFCFDNIQAWLCILAQVDWLCPLESFADYMAELAELEEFPSPTELNGIDLRSGYEFIKNGMLGLPQPSINSQTMKFLVTEMQALIEAVNSDDGDDVAYTMYDAIEKCQNFSGLFGFNKLDPFGLGW